MNIKDNQKAQDELIREILSLKEVYGISGKDFGIILMAIGCGMMKNDGATEENICEMIRSGK